MYANAQANSVPCVCASVLRCYRRPRLWSSWLRRRRSSRRRLLSDRRWRTHARPPDRSKAVATRGCRRRVSGGREGVHCVSLRPLLRHAVSLPCMPCATSAAGDTRVDPGRSQATGKEMCSSGTVKSCRKVSVEGAVTAMGTPLPQNAPPVSGLCVWRGCLQHCYGVQPKLPLKLGPASRLQAQLVAV